MKLQSKIQIDLLAFFKSGTFDYIKLGQTKEWILNNFPDPDDTELDKTVINARIWRYGNIEFHFYQSNSIYLIYSDYVETLDGGESLELDKWILSDYSKLCLSFVLEELNKAGIDYTKKTHVSGITLILQSGVELGFHQEYGEEIEDPNQLRLSYFSFMQK